MGRILSNGVDYSGLNLITPECYSTEERVVGCWTDGKPLYVKAFELSTAITLNSNTWTSLGISMPNCIVKKVFAGSSYDETTIGAINGNIDNNTLQVLQTRNSGFQIDFVVVYYIKTTDTAGSGVWTPSGIPTVHYSTEEHVVGTWIDGSTVFEKTFDLGSNTDVSNSTWQSLGITITNLSLILDCWGVNTSGSLYDLIAYHTNGAINAQSSRNGNNAPANVRYITIRYTKSS